MAISALPPFNGFFSEWLTFQALFQGIINLDFLTKWIFIAAAGSLAFTGGLALACFVKAFGATFLARPRSEEVKHTRESSISLLIGMGALATLSLLFGIFSGYITSALDAIGRDFNIFRNAPTFVSVSAHQSLATGNFSFVSAPAFFGFLIIIFIVVWLVVKYFVYGKQKIRAGATWDCGTNLTPRMEITATGFSRSIITIFNGILKPTIQKEIEYRDEDSRYLPASRTIVLSVNDIYQTYFYTPVSKFVISLSSRVKKVQGGNINVYLFYIFAALLVALFLV
jgi:hydrogenase-4 component B